MIKTVSLETAKLLKEAGFRQDTDLQWYQFQSTIGNSIHTICSANAPHWTVEKKRLFTCSAPTTDELLEELPSDNGLFRGLEIKKLHFNEYFYSVGYLDNNNDWCDKCFDNKSLPEALAQMWLWLKKKKLI